MKCIMCDNEIALKKGAEWVEIRRKESVYMGDRTEVIEKEISIVCAECWDE